MLSHQSIRQFSYIIVVGYWTKLLPFKWNAEQEKLDVIKYINVWRAFICCSIIFRLIMHGTTCLTMLTQPLPMATYIFGCFIMTAVLLGLVIEVYNLLNTYVLASYINGTLTLARDLAIHHKLSTTTSVDGAETLTKLISFGNLTLLLIFWVMDFIQLQTKFPLYMLLSSDSFLWNLTMATALAYATMPLLFNITFLVVYEINYANCMSKFMTLLKFNPSHSKEQANKTHLMYRSHQLLHRYADNVSKYSNLAAVVCTAMIQISCLYIVTKYKSRPELAAASILVLCIDVSCTKILMSLAEAYTLASNNYPNSFKEQRFFNSLSYKEFKEQEKIFKTHHPLRFQIGPFAQFSKTTFLTLTLDVVLQNVISLIVTYG